MHSYNETVYLMIYVYGIHTIRPYTTNPKLNKVQIHGYGFTCVCVCACVSVCSACLEDAESKSQLSLPKNTTRDSLS